MKFFDREMEIKRLCEIQEMSKKTTGKILKLIMDNPHISQDKIAEIIGFTVDGVFWNIKKLKAKGIIERIGSRKGGYWKVHK